MRNIEQLLRDLKEKLKEVEKNSGAKDVETRREFNEVVQQLASLTGGAPETRSSRAQAAAAAPASQAPIVNPAEANTEAPKAMEAPIWPLMQISPSRRTTTPADCGYAEKSDIIVQGKSSVLMTPSSTKRSTITLLKIVPY